MPLVKELAICYDNGGIGWLFHMSLFYLSHDKWARSHDHLHRERVMLEAIAIVVLRMFQLGWEEERRASGPAIVWRAA